jgi:hypothetical protein
MSFKFWLRGPADDPQVEIVGEHAYYWSSSHFSERRDRSVMRELLGEEGSRRFQISEGRWLLPGPPP